RREVVVHVGDLLAVPCGVVTFGTAHESIAPDAPAGGGRFAGTATPRSLVLRWPPLHPKGGVSACAVPSRPLASGSPRPPSTRDRSPSSATAAPRGCAGSPRACSS